MKPPPPGFFKIKAKAIRGQDYSRSRKWLFKVTSLLSLSKTTPITSLNASFLIVIGYPPFCFLSFRHFGDGMGADGMFWPGSEQLQQLAARTMADAW
jgi:hypothetical protein